MATKSLCGHNGSKAYFTMVKYKCTTKCRTVVFVQASTSQGHAIALGYACFSTQPVINLLIVSPLIRGSNPYPLR